MIITAIAYALGFLASWSLTSINEDVQLDTPRRLMWAIFWPIVGICALPLFLHDVRTMRRLGVKKFGSVSKVRVSR